MWNGTNLTLKDANIVHTDGCAIDAEGDLYIILEGENTVSASATGNVYQGCENGLAAIHSTGKINIYDGPGPLPDSSLPTIGSINASVVNTVGDHADGIRAADDINLNNDGWNVIGCLSFMNQPILRYSNEIRSAVLIVHGEKAHSCYFSRDAYADMIKDNPWKDNKELMIIPEAVHTDLYDGGGKDAIPFDKLESFFMEYLK